jgi:large subunit ribosomal protein L20
MKSSKVRIQLKSLQFMFRDRKRKKRLFSKLFIQRINSSLTHSNYAKFIHQLKINNIKLNKKVLSNLIITEHSTFQHLFNYTLSQK